MPLKLVPPRAGKSTNWTIRGAYLGATVDQTSGSPERKVASRKLASIKDEIERGAFSKPGAPTFASAALAYDENGGDRRFIREIAVHFGDLPLERVDQAAVDRAAIALYPHASAATRNRQVYTPVSAILRHSGVSLRFKRPKGAKGERRIAYLEPTQAFALLEAARAVGPDFEGLLTFLLYTGARLGEALALRCEEVSLLEERALIRQTKTEGARTAYLPPAVVAALANLPRGLARPGQRVFALTKCGRLYSKLDRAAARAGITIPEGVAFHIFRHTWATWMRRYAGLDTAGLVETGAWRGRQSAAVYEHLDASEESRKAILLPSRRGKVVESGS